MKKEAQFISLQEATKYCNYSQEYLSLRARQGKLKSMKIGRNWVTTKEWVEEYLKTLGSKEIRTKTKTQSIKAEPPLNLPIETPNQKLQISLNVVPVPKIRLRFSAIFILVLILGGLFLLEQVKPEFLPKKIKNFGQDLTITLAEMSSKEAQASTIKVFERYSQWLKENLESRVPGFKTVYLAADDFVNKKLGQASRLIIRPFSKFYQLVFSPEEKPEIKEPEIKEPEKLETKEGMVVVPSEGKDEETIKKIKESFSDKVRVETKDETSGFITPIFKEREGEKYLYIMVPVKN